MSMIGLTMVLFNVFLCFGLRLSLYHLLCFITVFYYICFTAMLTDEIEDRTFICYLD